MELTPGDIVEIEVPGGLAYVQVTHRHVAYPEVVRALPGPHATRPGDLAALATAPTMFRAMVPLSAAIERGRIAGVRVGSAAVPEADTAFPVFGTPVRDRTGAIAYWWFWDGDGLRYDPDPDAGAAGPLREVLTAEALTRRLAGLSGGP